MTKEKIEDLINKHRAYRDYAEFKRKRSIYQDHYFDAEKYEIERDEEQEIIDKLQAKLAAIEGGNRRNGSHYIQCIDCNSLIHQRRVRLHTCKLSSITQYNKRLTL